MNPGQNNKNEANTTGGFSQKGNEKEKNERKNSTHRNRDDSEEKFELNKKNSLTTTNLNSKNKVFHFPTHTKAASFSITKSNIF